MKSFWKCQNDLIWPLDCNNYWSYMTQKYRQNFVWSTRKILDTVTDLWFSNCCARGRVTKNLYCRSNNQQIQKVRTPLYQMVSFAKTVWGNKMWCPHEHLHTNQLGCKFWASVMSLCSQNLPQWNIKLPPAHGGGSNLIHCLHFNAHQQNFKP